ncbi:MAG: hypothetical protein KA354_02435 [Phycisphaerae bacterium]|nr:hypothetical protein [Phycisphaerae bacterium]
MIRRILLVSVLIGVAEVEAQWRVGPPSDERESRPGDGRGDLKPIRPGDKLPHPDRFCWLFADLGIPETIEGRPAAGQPVGLRIAAGDGGEVWLDGTLRCRFDNDHPALVMVSEKAVPGQSVSLAVQVYKKVQGGDNFDEANWALIDPKRATGRVGLRIDAAHLAGVVPDGIVGLSQGGGLADYEDSTAARLKDGGFKWFRMDNVLTHALKKDPDGKLVHEWTDLDRRVDFMAKAGTVPILAVSYMPEVLDAVPNPDRQSAPRDYVLWEELCYLAAKRCLDRGRRVPYWEVWNEVNTGWLKPGPQDTGSEAFQKLYDEALGTHQSDREVVRRFEAYCKLYQASARGVLRADAEAKIGGPALASGPMESSPEHGHCVHGKGFARGLMLWCRQQKLPLDFVSWHEYFQSAEVMAKEAEVFRGYLSDFPEFQKSVTHFMVTEWNEAWWADRPQDHEIGAAYCADGVIRAFLPHGIDRPCFFYVKQNDMGFRGDYSMLMKDNVTKPTYHMARIFNQLSGRWLAVAGGDEDICAVAAWDEKKPRLAVVMVNFRFRHALRRTVRLSIDSLPASIKSSRWQEWTVDATHSNVWHDRDQADLTMTRSGHVDGSFTWDGILQANSITLLELVSAEGGAAARP